MIKQKVVFFLIVLLALLGLYTNHNQQKQQIMLFPEIRASLQNTELGGLIAPNLTMYYWKKNPVKYYIDPEIIGDLRNYFIYSFIKWHSSFGRLSFQEVVEPQIADIYLTYGDLKNEIAITEVLNSKETSMSLTINKIDINIKEMSKVRIVFNKSSFVPIFKFNPTRVIVHEIGHALGLWGHSLNPKRCMYFEANPSDIHQCDDLSEEVKILNFLYDSK